MTSETKKMRTDLMSRVAIAALLIVAALCYVGGFLRTESGWDWAVFTGPPLIEIARYGSPLIFICSGVLILLRPRWGYALGALSGLIDLPWLILNESSFGDSSWVFLNAAVGLMTNRELAIAKLSAILRIVSVGLVTTAAVACLLRLLPARWSLRGLPLCQRTWPALSVGLLVVAVWFVHSVMPYRVPVIANTAPAELRMLHVEKRSLHFDETAEIVEKDGTFYLNRTQRRLFRYEWKRHGISGVLSHEARDRVTALINSPELGSLHTAPARQLWSWNADGWDVVLKDQRLLAFTSDYHKVPREITGLFDEIAEVPGTERPLSAVCDICFGLCYGPAAALGFQYSNKPCFALASGSTQCR